MESRLFNVKSRDFLDKDDCIKTKTIFCRVLAFSRLPAFTAPKKVLKTETRKQDGP